VLLRVHISFQSNPDGPGSAAVPGSKLIGRVIFSDAFNARALNTGAAVGFKWSTFVLRVGCASRQRCAEGRLVRIATFLHPTTSEISHLKYYSLHWTEKQTVELESSGSELTNHFSRCLRTSTVRDACACALRRSKIFSWPKPQWPTGRPINRSP
jgi:hypothetical protein